MGTIGQLLQGAFTLLAAFARLLLLAVWHSLTSAGALALAAVVVVLAAAAILLIAKRR